jgi:hypothetical protein
VSNKPVNKTSILTRKPAILKLKFLVATCILLFFFQAVRAQDVSELRISGRYRGQSLPVFFNTLSSEYGIRFFYQKPWIDTIAVHRDFDGTPLIQVLNSIFQHKNVTWRTFQDDAVVIFPIPDADRKRYVDELQLLVIGDPLNEGRYKTATLQGKIVDGKTGDPLPNAVILEIKSNKGTSSDSRGLFTFELPTGEHNLQLSYLGYQPVNQKLRLIENGYAEFEIFEESLSIGEVTITGEYADLPRAQMSMIRMETRKIRDLPALMGEVDVMRGMTMQAGVQTVSELSSGFNVRGGNTDQNLLLINGSPVFNASHLFGFLSLINPDLVDNFRLFKGGMPARYGERVASIMEVDLKDGNEETLRIAGGLGIINSRLALDGPLTKDKKLTLTAGGRSSYTNWILKQIPNPDISQSVTHFYDAAGKLTYRFNAHNRISGMTYFSHDKYSTSAQTIMEYGSLLANMQSRNRFSDKTTGEGSLSFSRYNYRLTDLANGKSEEAYFLDNQLKYSSMKYNLRYRPNENHTIEGGFNAIYYQIEPGEVIGKADTTLIVSRNLNPEKALEWAGYLSDEIEITPGFSISFGARLSGFSNIGTPVVYKYDPAKPKAANTVIDSITYLSDEIVNSYRNFEPRVLLRYETSPGNVLKLNVQRISQYVFQVSNNSVISPAETWKVSDFHLKPLISDQIALGFETTSLHKTIEFSAEGYYKKLQNLLEYKNGAQLLMNPRIETSLIPADGYSYGLELTGKKNRGRLTGWVNYTWSRTMRKTTSEWEEDQLWEGAYYPSVYDRPHDLSVVGTYNISRRWRFTSNFVFLSGRPVTLPERLYQYGGERLIYYSERNKYRMPPYHRLDMAITLDENLRVKRMWKGSWTLSVYNVYGRHNPYSVYYRKTVPTAENDYRLYSLFKLSVIGIPVPSLTYNFKF